MSTMVGRVFLLLIQPGPSGDAPSPRPREAFDKLDIPPEVKKMSICHNTGETILHKAARLGYKVWQPCGSLPSTPICLCSICLE